jgi:CheY-like chemotaxis protein
MQRVKEPIVSQERATMLNIIHLEDERELSEGMAFVIQEEAPNAMLTQFVSSDDLIAYIDREWQTVNLFILDVRVPGAKTGLEVARYLREIGYAGVIVVTSAYEPPSDALLQELNIHYFRKPWELPQTILNMLSLVMP